MGYYPALLHPKMRRNILFGTTRRQAVWMTGRAFTLMLTADIAIVGRVQPTTLDFT
jgi:hypothetical protein